MFSVFVCGYLIDFMLITGVTTQAALQPQTGNNFFQGLTEQTANNMNMASMFPNCPMLNNMMPGNPVSSGSGQLSGRMGNALPKPAFSAMPNGVPSKVRLHRGASPISANGRIAFNVPAFSINSLQGQPSHFMVPSGCRCGVTHDTNGCPVCKCDEYKNTETSSTSTKTTVLSTSMAIHRATVVDNSTTSYSTQGKDHDTLKPMSSSPTTVLLTLIPKIIKFSLNNYSKSKPIADTTRSTSPVKTYSETRILNRATSSSHVLSTTYWAQKLETDSELVNEKSFPGVIALTAVVIVLFIISGMLFSLWRKSKYALKREKNELYFVEKSFRQQSLSSEEDESLKNADDIIYSLIGRRVPPDLPMRSPPLTPTAPPPSASPTGKTVFKIPPDDLRHDYLELI